MMLIRGSENGQDARCTRVHKKSPCLAGGVARIARFFAGLRNGIWELLRKWWKVFFGIVGGATTTRNMGCGAGLWRR